MSFYQSMVDKARQAHEAFLAAVAAYREAHHEDMGGDLHLVLEDGNVFHETVGWCWAECREHGDKPGEKLCRMMLRVDEDVLFRLYEQDWKEPPRPVCPTCFKNYLRADSGGWWQACKCPTSEGRGAR